MAYTQVKLMFVYIYIGQADKHSLVHTGPKNLGFRLSVTIGVNVCKILSLSEKNTIYRR